MTQIRDYAYTDDGAAVVGATASAYVIGETTPTDTDTTDTSGMWEFPSLPDAGYDVKLVNGSSTRWLRGNVSAQFNKITSYLDGITAPLEDASIDVDMLKDIVADTITVPTGNTNALDVWLGRLLTVLLAATGETHWYDVPANDLATLVINFGEHTHDGTHGDTSSLNIGHESASLAAEANVLDTAWADGPSISLTAGTWLINANVELANIQDFGAQGYYTGQNTSTVDVKLWDGTTDYLTSTATVIPLQTVTVPVSTIQTLAAAATVKVSAREQSGKASGIIKMHTHTHITAIRVG